VERLRGGARVRDEGTELAHLGLFREYRCDARSARAQKLAHALADLVVQRELEVATIYRAGDVAEVPGGRVDLLGRSSRRRKLGRRARIAESLRDLPT
jgi:hypothetical protein